MDNFYTIIERLLVAQHKRQIDLVRETGIGGGTVRSWRDDRVPSVTNAYKVAQFFNITVEELITGVKPEEVLLRPEEKELLELFNKFNESDKAEILTLAKLKGSKY